MPIPGPHRIVHLRIDCQRGVSRHDKMLPSGVSPRQESGYPLEEDGDGRNPSGTTGEARVSGADAEAVSPGAAPPRGRLLDEVCEMTGYHRKAAIRLLRRDGAGRCGRRRGRPRRYGPEVVTALRAIWTAAGYP